MANSEYAGRSLKYFRELIGDCPPRFMSCDIAAQQLPLWKATQPPLGSLVFYDDHPNGNVALNLGFGAYLGLDSTGYPFFASGNPYDAISIGHITTEQFRAISKQGRRSTLFVRRKVT